MSRKLDWLILGAGLLLIAGSACGQAPAPTVEVDAQAITVTFDVQPAVYTVPATLTATWNAPGASSCTASGAGDWSGIKAASGTQPITGLAGEMTLFLSCEGVASVTLAWTNPTRNTDGSSYTDAKNLELYRANSLTGLDSASPLVLASTATTYQFTNPPTGLNYFGLKAVNAADAKSGMSAPASKDVQRPTAATQLTVRGSATEPPPTGVVSVSSDGYAVKANELKLAYVLDGIVGTVQLGAPCDETRRMGSTDYYAINRAKYVTWTTNRRPKTVVVQCAAPQGKAVTGEPAPLEEGE